MMELQNSNFQTGAQPEIPAWQTPNSRHFVKLGSTFPARLDIRMGSFSLVVLSPISLEKLSQIHELLFP